MDAPRSWPSLTRFARRGSVRAGAVPRVVSAKAMKARLAILAAALGLSACGEAYYAYDYDPLAGPRGHYVSPFDPHPRSTAPACRQWVMSGPYEDGFRGPYYAGPYCADAVALAPAR